MPESPAGSLGGRRFPADHGDAPVLTFADVQRVARACGLDAPNHKELVALLQVVPDETVRCYAIRLTTLASIAKPVANKALGAQPQVTLQPLPRSRHPYETNHDLVWKNHHHRDDTFDGPDVLATASPTASTVGTDEFPYNDHQPAPRVDVTLTPISDALSSVSASGDDTPTKDRPVNRVVVCRPPAERAPDVRARGNPLSRTSSSAEITLGEGGRGIPRSQSSLTSVRSALNAVGFERPAPAVTAALLMKLSVPSSSSSLTPLTLRSPKGLIAIDGSSSGAASYIREDHMSLPGASERSIVGETRFHTLSNNPFEKGESPSPTPSSSAPPHGTVFSEPISPAGQLSQQLPLHVANTLRLDTDDAGFDFINDYLVQGAIGQGSQGQVLAVTDVRTGEPRAMKVMRRDRFAGRHRAALGMHSPHSQSSTSDLGRTFHQEVAIMKKLHHRNVVRLREVVDDPLEKRIYLVMDLADGGLIAPDSDPDTGRCHPISRSVLTTFFRQLISGVSYLHRHHVYHRDIKPDNLLLHADTELGETIVKLVDFGVAEVSRSGLVNGVVGTPLFMAPELHNATRHCQVNAAAADVWAIGATFFSLLTGRPPFLPCTPGQTIAAAIRDNPLEFSPEVSRGATRDATPKGAALRRDSSTTARFADGNVGDEEFLTQDGCPTCDRGGDCWEMLLRGMLEKDVALRWRLRAVRKWVRLHSLNTAGRRARAIDDAAATAATGGAPTPPTCSHSATRARLPNALSLNLLSAADPLATPHTAPGSTDHSATKSEAMARMTTGVYEHETSTDVSPAAVPATHPALPSSPGAATAGAATPASTATPAPSPPKSTWMPVDDDEDVEDRRKVMGGFMQQLRLVAERDRDDAHSPTLTGATFSSKFSVGGVSMRLGDSSVIGLREGASSGLDMSFVVTEKDCEEALTARARPQPPPLPLPLPPPAAARGARSSRSNR